MAQIKSAKEAGVFLKSDEPILGDCDFVDAVLRAAGEQLENRDMYRRQGIDLEALVPIVADLPALDVGEVLTDLGGYRCEVCCVSGRFRNEIQLPHPWPLP